MNAPQRRLLRQNIILGIVMTAVAIVFDRQRFLRTLEGWYYDQRAIHCQYFTPRPTDKLIHVDIDDAATNSIGAWPWPRHVIAGIIEELHQDGATTLGMDVLFPDLPATFVQARDDALAQGLTSEDLEDQSLSAAIKDFGSVVLASELTLGNEPLVSATHQTAVAILTSNLELSDDELQATLQSKHLPHLNPDEVTAARREATTTRVTNALGRESLSLEELRHSLLPRMSAYYSSVQGRVLESAYEYVSARKAIEPKLYSGLTNLPNVVHTTGEMLPLPQLISVNTTVGCVDILPGIDGVVRYVPLWFENKGKLMPQLGLAFACSYLGADLSKVSFNGDQMSIPVRGGPPILLPTWSDIDSAGARTGTCFDAPCFGRFREWETMYDYPRHLVSSQHLPIAQVWKVVETKKGLRQNNLSIEKGLRLMLAIEKDDDLQAAYKAHPLDPDDTDSHLKLIDQFLTNQFVTDDLAGYDKMTPQERAKNKDFANLQDLASLRDLLLLAKSQDLSILQDLAKQQKEITARVAGKAVLIGFVATGQVDFHATSVDPQCPGVVVHGEIFNAIVSGFTWRRLPPISTTLATAVIGLLITGIAVSLHARSSIIATISVLIGYLLVNGEWFFDLHHEILGAAGPTLAVMLVWGMITIVRFVAEVTEHNRIRKRFSSYADPILVKYVTEHPELEKIEGAVKEMSVVFTDLAGSTTLAETLKERFIAVLGRYTDRMVPVIQENNGLVNKFMGDGIMFSFGAPYPNHDHAADAMKTVLGLHEELATFNLELLTEGLPSLGMRAGVATGEVVVGDAGGVKRCDYTCMGDVTNFASRLEAANKAFGTRSLVSARTVELSHGMFLVRPIGRIQVVGKKLGVMSFEPICAMDKATDDQKLDVQMTGIMVEQYIASDFKSCLAAAESLHAMFPSKLTHKYIELARDAINDPPQNFSGNIVLEHK